MTRLSVRPTLLPQKHPIEVSPPIQQREMTIVSLPAVALFRGEVTIQAEQVLHTFQEVPCITAKCVKLVVQDLKRT